MQTQASLKEIAKAIESTWETWDQFYNRTTGEIIAIPNDMNDCCDIDDDLESEIEEIENNPDNYVILPEQYELNEFRIMEDFSYYKNNDKLISVLHRSKPYRNFKDQIKIQGIEEEYYSYRFDRFVILARNWCSDNNIEYIEDIEG